MSLVGSKLFTRARQATGCAGKELCILTVIRGEEDYTCPRSVLLHKTGMKRSNLCTTLKKLEEKGLIEKGKMIRLTEKGKERLLELEDYYRVIFFEEDFYSKIKKHLLTNRIL